MRMLYSGFSWQSKWCCEHDLGPCEEGLQLRVMSMYSSCRIMSVM